MGGSHQRAARKTKRPGSPVLTANVLKGVVAANATFDQSTVTVFPTALGSLDSFLCHVASEKLFSYLKNFYPQLYVFPATGQRFPLHYNRANMSMWWFFLVHHERDVVTLVGAVIEALFLQPNNDWMQGQIAGECYVKTVRVSNPVSCAITIVLDGGKIESGYSDGSTCRWLLAGLAQTQRCYC